MTRRVAALKLIASPPLSQMAKLMRQDFAESCKEIANCDRIFADCSFKVLCGFCNLCDLCDLSFEKLDCDAHSIVQVTLLHEYINFYEIHPHHLTFTKTHHRKILHCHHEFSGQHLGLCEGGSGRI